MHPKRQLEGVAQATYHSFSQGCIHLTRKVHIKVENCPVSALTHPVYLCTPVRKRVPSCSLFQESVCLPRNAGAWQRHIPAGQQLLCQDSGVRAVLRVPMVVCASLCWSCSLLREVRQCSGLCQGLAAAGGCRACSCSMLKVPHQAAQEDWCVTE